MKQLIFLSAMMVMGAVGSLFEPFWGVLLYYLLSVLRPQALWEWALPRDVRWSLLAALIALAGFMLNFPRIGLRGRLNLVAMSMMGYSLLVLVSLVMAHDPDLAQNWAWEYAKILLMSLVATAVISRVWHVHAIGSMVLLTVGYVAWDINALYLFDGRLDVFHRGFGGLDNNGAGLLLSMGLPFAYAFGVTARKAWQRIVSWGMGLMMLHAILMSYSRGAMLATGVSVLWVLSHHRPRIRASAIAVGLCVAVSVLAGPEIRHRFLTTTNFHQDPSAQSRLDSWAAAWEMAWDHPLTGQGIRNSRQFIYNYGADRQGRTIHNQYLQVAADTGIPAAMVYTTMLCLAIYNFGKARRICRDYLDDRPSDLLANDLSLRMTEMEELSVACQASLISFAFGGVFLSLEVFELPWLLIVVAGVLPDTLDRHLEERLELQAGHRPGGSGRPVGIPPVRPTPVPGKTGVWPRPVALNPRGAGMGLRITPEGASGS
jgi:probable O-glycosylation ligase (exosortase A-associated)